MADMSLGTSGLNNPFFLVLTKCMCCLFLLASGFPGSWSFGVLPKFIMLYEMVIRENCEVGHFSKARGLDPSQAYV